MFIDILKTIDQLKEGNNIIIPIFKGDIDSETYIKFLKILTPSEKKLLKDRVENSKFKGDLGQLIQFKYSKGKTLYLYGIGLKEKFSIDGWQREISRVYRKLENIYKNIVFDSKNFTIYIPWGDRSISPNKLFIKTYLGFKLSNYKFNKYISNKEGFNIENLSIFIKYFNTDKENSEYVKKYCENLANSIYFARDLANEPPNILNPDSYQKIVKDRFKNKKNVDLKIYNFEQLEEMGLNLLAAVGRGSKHKPCLIELSYKSKNKDSKTVALVGKGITYDTGGYSLKPDHYLEMMHLDMCGSSTTLATFDFLTNYELENSLKCYLVVAENMISGDSYRVTDIVTAYNKKTVEILNTDAEGRLCLADGIAYASEMEADIVVECSTLTGACMVALGRQIGGLMTRDDQLAKELLLSAKESEEKLWRMPMDNCYQDQLKSKVADLKNIGSSPMGGALFAALFLEKFVKEGTKFLHIDMAGPSMLTDKVDFYPANGTGYGVLMLTKFIENL